MVYLCKRKINGKEYYIIRKSFRVGKRIYTKDLEYLGKEISSSKAVELIKKYPEMKNGLERIIQTKNTKQSKKEDKFFSSKQISEIKTILNSYSKLSHANKKRFEEKIKINFIVENATIEPFINQEINRGKMRHILAKKNSKEKKTMEALYISNYERILKYLRKNKNKFDIKIMLQIYGLLNEKHSWEKGLRKQKIDVPGKPFKTSKPENLRNDLKRLFLWYNSNENKIEPLALAILFHHKFEKIHPFMNFNGEMGRIILNYILSIKKYPPIIIPLAKKGEFYHAMDKAYPCLKKDLLSTDMRYYDELINFMYKQFVKTYWENFS